MAPYTAQQPLTAQRTMTAAGPVTAQQPGAPQYVTAPGGNGSQQFMPGYPQAPPNPASFTPTSSGGTWGGGTWGGGASGGAWGGMSSFSGAGAAGNPYAQSSAQWGQMANDIGNPWQSGYNGFQASDNTLRNPAVQKYITEQYLPFYEGAGQRSLAAAMRQMGLAGAQARGQGSGSNAAADAYGQAMNNMINQRSGLMERGQQDIGSQLRYEDTRGTERYRDQASNYWKAMQAKDQAQTQSAAWLAEQQQAAYKRELQQQATRNAWDQGGSAKNNRDQTAFYQQQQDRVQAQEQADRDRRSVWDTQWRRYQGVRTMEDPMARKAMIPNIRGLTNK